MPPLGEQGLDVLTSVIVQPLLKNPSLDMDSSSQLNPVSNLPFLGKVIEQVAA